MSHHPAGPPPPPPGDPRGAPVPPPPAVRVGVWLPGTPVVGAPEAIWSGAQGTDPAPGAPPVPGGPGPAHAPAEHLPTAVTRQRRLRRRPGAGVVAALLGVGLLGAVAAAGYLWTTSDAWERRAEGYLGASQDLGAQLASARSELAGARSELAAVREQLTTAQERIVQLADEKAQLGDDREVQRQLVDYQERVTEAAGRVALALDQCVQGQNQLIGYMADADLYDPAALESYATDVQDLCQRATEANTALQSELSR